MEEKINLRAGLPAGGMGRSAPEVLLACCMVRQLMEEMALQAGDRALLRRDRRHLARQLRQLSMYVCHVALAFSMAKVGACFGRDRKTVSYACRLVEDRRDDPGFDAFVAMAERLAIRLFGVLKEGADG